MLSKKKQFQNTFFLINHIQKKLLGIMSTWEGSVKEMQKGQKWPSKNKWRTIKKKGKKTNSSTWAAKQNITTTQVNSNANITQATLSESSSPQRAYILKILWAMTGWLFLGDIWDV